MNLKVWITVLFVLAACCCMWIYQPFEDPSLTEAGPTYSFVWNQPKSAAGGDNQMALQWHVLQVEWLIALLVGSLFHMSRGWRRTGAMLPKHALAAGNAVAIVAMVYPTYMGGHLFGPYYRRGWLFHHLSEENLYLPEMKLELAVIFIVTLVGFTAAMVWSRKPNQRMLESHQGSV